MRLDPLVGKGRPEKKNGIYLQNIDFQHQSVKNIKVIERHSSTYKISYNLI